MSMVMSPIDQFVSNINHQRKERGSAYECWIWNRGRKGCKGTNLYWRPSGVSETRLRICRKHDGQYYEPARVYLLERLAADHKMGLHGEGEDRKVFGEDHSDTTGYFRLHCQDCLDEMASEELGVEPDQVEQAQVIKDRMARAQQSYDNAVYRFNQLWDEGKHAFAIKRHGAGVTQASAMLDLYKRVLFLMEFDKSNMVVAYDKAVGEVKLKLIQDSYSDDDERSAASQFVRGDRYW